jgi:uncharacterized protein (TIGR03435 family)
VIFRVKSGMVAGAHLLFAAALMAVVPSALGQAGAAAASSSPTSTEYVPTMAFDVASVRENKDVDMRGFTMGGGFTPHTSTFRAMNWMIDSLIYTAYGVKSYQVVGAPSWPFPTLFMVEAKGDTDADAKMAGLNKEQQEAEQEHMLRSLLEDRFKLKTHWETKEGDVFNLVIAKVGLKMGAEGSIPLSFEEKEQSGGHPTPLSQRCDQQECTFTAHACPMDRLVEMLTWNFGRPVIDKTGLTGKYDFVLKFKGRTDQDRPADDMDPTPPMDRAVQEQLGLKLEAGKGPRKVLVIDHIEKPSAN